MSLVIQVRDLDALKLLLRYAEVYGTIVEEAAETEDAHIMEVILDDGNWPVDRSLRGGSIPSILSLAVRNTPFLNHLLHHRAANPNTTSTLNETALTFAIREGTLSAVKILLAPALGTNIFQGDLLHAAAQREDSLDVTFIMDFLVQRGGGKLPLDTHEFDNDIAKPLRYGFRCGTALHVACYKRSYEAVRALLRHGADPFCLEMQGARRVEPTPFQMASQDPVLTQIFRNHLAAR